MAAIDKIYGKKIATIMVSIPNSPHISIDFCPTHSFCEKFMDLMLQCEVANDKFIFEHPALGKSRPPQLADKIARLQSIIDKYRRQPLI